MNKPNLPIVILQEDGIVFTLVKSRVSSLPVVVDGMHAILGAEMMVDGNMKPLMFHEVNAQATGKAFAALLAFAKATSAAAGAPGMYDIVINGPGKASRENFHAHLRMVFATKEQLLAMKTIEAPHGYEFVRAVDPAGFIIPVKEPTPPPVEPATSA
jgi:hypothetical protein